MKKLRFLLALFVASQLFCFNIQGELRTYQFPNEIVRSDKYKITVKQGDNIQEAFVHMTDCPEQEYPLEKILPLLYDRTFSWTSFEFDDAPIEICVSKLFGDAAWDVTISPKKYGIVPEHFDGYTVRFKMNKPEYVSVRFYCNENRDEYNQIKHGLMLFADEPETDVPELSAEGVVSYRPNESMYTDKTI